MGDIVDVLDRDQFGIDLVQVVDQGAVTGRAEQEGVVIGPEGFVLRIHGDGVRGLVLEGEGDVVFHAVTRFEVGFYLGEGLFEKSLVLRGDGDDKVAGAVGIAHVGRGLHEVLGDGGTYFPVLIAVELDDTLGLGAIAQAFVRQDFLQDRLPIRGRVLLRTEECLRIESELVDLCGEFRPGSGFRKVLALLQGSQSREDVLEHAGSGARSRHELAFSVDLRSFIILDGRVGLGLGKDADAALRGGRAHDLHPGETLPEVVDLLLDGADGGSPLLDLVDVFLSEHGYTFWCYSM